MENENQPPTHAENASGPPHDLIQYPENHGVIALAESYDLSGTEIAWEDNPYTQSPRENPEEERKALIHTNDGNVFYLRGDSLYDVGHSLSAGDLKETRWTSRTPMPDVTIGEPVPFSPGATIEQVIVQAGEVTAGDSRSENILAEARREDVNPFNQIDTDIKRLRVRQIRARAKEQSRVDLSGLAVRDDKDDTYHSYTYRFRDERAHDITTDTVRSPQHPGDIRLGTTTTPPGSGKDHDEGPDFRKTSDHGVPISPSVYLPKAADGNPGEDDYVPRLEVRMKESAKASARALGDEIVERHYDSWDMTKEQAERLANASLRLGELVVDETVATAQFADKGSRYTARFYADVARGAADIYWQAAKQAGRQGSKAARKIAGKIRANK